MSTNSDRRRLCPSQQCMHQTINRLLLKTQHATFGNCGYQSINQSKRIYTAPYAANESETHNSFALGVCGLIHSLVLRQKRMPRNSELKSSCYRTVYDVTWVWLDPTLEARVSPQQRLSCLIHKEAQKVSHHAFFVIISSTYNLYYTTWWQQNKQ